MVGAWVQHGTSVVPEAGPMDTKHNHLDQRPVLGRELATHDVARGAAVDTYLVVNFIVS